MKAIAYCKILPVLIAIAFVFRLAGPQLVSAIDAGANAHGHLSVADYKFMAQAAHGNNMELALAHIGLQKGTDTGVRAFMQHLVDVHQKAGSDLTLLATQKGADLPEIGTIEDRNQLNVAKLDGSLFDQDLMECLIADEKYDVILYQAEADAANDPDLKAWAGTMLPIAAQNLKLAQDTYATLPITARN